MGFFSEGNQINEKRIKKQAILFVMLSSLLILALLYTVSNAETVWNPEIVDSTGDTGTYSSIALDSSQLPHITYYDETNFDLKYASWTGSQWEIQTVDSDGYVGQYTSLALDSNGYPHISYYDVTNDNLKYALWNGLAWDIETVDSSGNVGQYTSLALDSNGYPHISYYDVTNANLKYALWNGFAWNIQTVDSEGEVGAFSSLALDSTGNPHISYYDVTNANLKYALWNGFAWNIQTVDSEGDVGYGTSVAVDSNEYPHISYYDSLNGHLKYATWNGLSWSTQIVDSTEWVGFFPSIALDSAENSHISYLDLSNFDLKYAVWNGLAWDIETVDSSGNVGRYTSLALDSNGYPFISYYDETNGDLKCNLEPPEYLFGSIVINEGDSYTNSISVTLTLTYESPDSTVSQVRYSNDGEWDTEPWESPASSRAWTLSSGDGTKTVYYQIRDNAGNVFSTSDTITLDTTAPTGSIQINGGASSTTTDSVTLSLTYSDATSGVDQVRYSNDGVWDTESWESATSPKAWTLSGGNGLKTVYYQVRDNAGNTFNTSDSITLDTTAPYGSITINDDGAYATSTSVTLSLTYEAPDSTVSQVRYSNDGVWDTETWEIPAATKTWALTGDDGAKTVYYQVKNAEGMVSSTYSDTIVLDTSTPSGSISINNGDASTTSTAVTLSLTYSDATSGVSQVRYSNDNSWDTETWEAPAAARAWTLTSGDDTKTVYYQIIDNAGLLSTTYSDTIILQSSSPSPSPSPTPTPEPTPTPSPSSTPTPSPTTSPTPSPTPSPSPSSTPTPTPTPPPEEQPVVLYVAVAAIAFTAVGATVFVLKKRR
jgi:hypothetical protein